MQILKLFQDKGLKKRGIVTSTDSKRGVVLDDLSKCGFKWSERSRARVVKRWKASRLDCSFRKKLKNDVRRCILSKRRAISCAMDDFPVPACPNRTRLHSEPGLFTQLTTKSKKAVRVLGRQPFSGVKREPVPYGISLIFASSSDNDQIDNLQAIRTTYQRLKLG